jgi:hypothetical protein
VSLGWGLTSAWRQPKQISRDLGPKLSHGPKRNLRSKICVLASTTCMHVRVYHELEKTRAILPQSGMFAI